LIMGCRNGDWPRYRATVLAFAAARGSVAIGGVNPRAAGTANDITAASGKAVFQETGVSDNIQVQAGRARGSGVRHA